LFGDSDFSVKLHLDFFQGFIFVVKFTTKLYCFVLFMWLASTVLMYNVVLIADSQRVGYSALVLSMLFSTGESIPLSYYGEEVC